MKNIRYACLILFLVTLCGPDLALAKDSPCPPYVEPLIIVTPLWSNPQYNESLDIQGIALLSSQSQFKETVKEEFPLGFTEAVQKLNTSFQIKHSPMPNGITCAQISQFEIRFGYPSVTVYLARDLLNTSDSRYKCAYLEMLTHEQKHVAADQRLVSTYSPHFHELASILARDIGVLRVLDPNDAEQQIHFAVDNYMKHLNVNMTTVHNNAQRRIDTQEEYNRLSEACNGAMARMLGKR